MHGVPRSDLLTVLTLLVVASWTATLGDAAPTPTCSMMPQGDTNTTSSPSTLSNSTISSNSTTGRSGLNEEVIAAAWYPGWDSATFPPSSIPWSKYNMMTYAFALTTADPSTLDLGGEEDNLQTFVQEAQANGVRALLSVGGWTGSQHFSDALSTAAGRTSFTQAITNIATNYSLDGIDFDWEYPNQAGIGCNTKSPNDTANFLTFLQELRADPVGSKLVLTVAASLKPFTGADGNPIADASDFANVLDFIAIMNYDVWGSWSTTTGPNAPLDDSCAAVSDRFGSADSAVAAWTAAHFPADQLLLGLASYGHSFLVTNVEAKTTAGSLNVYSPFDKADQPLGQGEVAGVTSTDVCGNVAGPSGVFYFNGLIASGFLDASGNPGDGMDYTFDNCSQTPFIYNQSSQVLISYDDATSFAAKGSFINSKSLAGFAVWHVAGDSSDNILLDAVHTAMGISADCPTGNGSTTTTATGTATIGSLLTTATGTTTIGSILTTDTATIDSIPTTTFGATPTTMFSGAPTTTPDNTPTSTSSGSPDGGGYGGSNWRRQLFG